MKTHMIRDRKGEWLETFCGYSVFLCRGYEPQPGSPGEAETADDIRVNVTDQEEEADCGRCRRALAAAKREH